MSTTLRFLARACLPVVVALCTSAHAAPMLQVTAGKLTGALGVNVGGAWYDVTFVEGSCVSLFTGCDDTSDFTFRNGADATSASEALLNQVLLNGTKGMFDSMPELTFGCSDTDICVVYTPFAIRNDGALLLATTNNTPGSDSALGGVRSKTADSTTSPSVVYARWSPAAAVPEPATLSLVAVAVMALVGMRRRVRPGIRQQAHSI